MYHLYVIETPGRDDLQQFLKDCGIIALTNYPIAIHQQEGFPFGAGEAHPILPETEAIQIRDLLRSAGVKSVQSHQRKYNIQFVKCKEVVDSGALGRIHTIHATGPGEPELEALDRVLPA